MKTYLVAKEENWDPHKKHRMHGRNPPILGDRHSSPYPEDNAWYVDLHAVADAKVSFDIDCVGNRQEVHARLIIKILFEIFQIVCLSSPPTIIASIRTSENL